LNGLFVIALFRFFSRWPLPALHAVGGVLGWLVYALSPTYRRHVCAHAELAGVGAAARRQSVAHAGKLVAELPRLWMGAPVPVRMEGEAHIAAAHAAGRGILFLTPHMGCFEITARAYAERFGQTPGRGMTVLYRPARQRWLREVVASSRHRPGLDTAPTTLAGVKQLIKALRAGGAVGLLPDQVPPDGMGVWAPFFGRTAYTMTLSARLAHTPGVVVLLAWGERLKSGEGYVVHVQPWTQDPLPADPESAAAAINRAMEGLIQQAPEQYLWGYARYKQPRGTAV
jgi:Kdo2-lipid IVA lauroyltransferase/acyltransferase